MIGCPSKCGRRVPSGLLAHGTTGATIAQRPQIRYRLRPCPAPIPKSFALLTPRLIGGVTSPGDAVVPAQTTPMRAIAAKHERGSGGFLRGGLNASRSLRPASFPRGRKNRAGRALPVQIGCPTDAEALAPCSRSAWQGAFFGLIGDCPLSGGSVGRALS